VAPGDLNYKLDRAEWLMYACSELARIIELKGGSSDCRKLLIRLKFGVGKELLPLVKLRNVGRVRARRLFNIGIRSLADVRRAEPRTLARAVGPGIARSILEQVGRSEEASPGLERVKMLKDDPASVSGAKTLLDFM
jgi:helicase